MVRGPKKHLKTLNAPSSWMMSKLSGVFAPKPSAGPHKSRDCLPLTLILRNRLKYALTGKEVMSILMNRLIKIDGKVRTDNTYPTGFMDVIDIEKTDEHFRILYDAKGRFAVHRITKEEAAYKLCRVKKVQLTAKGVPAIITHDGRTIRYPDPDCKINDVVMFNLNTGKIIDLLKFDCGNLCMITAGGNCGRVGIITHREKHKGSFEIIKVTDSNGHEFATRITNVFVIGKGAKPQVSIPKGKGGCGIRLTIIEEQQNQIKKSSK